MNLHSICQENSSRLEDSFNACIAGAADSATLQSFADKVVQDGQISFNMRPTVLLQFLLSGSHMNIYEWAESISTKSTKDKQAILKEKLGSYYERRLTFDGHFEGGEQFRYGALNIGGTGAEQYGEYCGVTDHSRIGILNEVSYIMGDSLNCYVTTEPKIDEVKLREECAVDTHKHFLATIKHATQVQSSTAPAQWRTMICSGTTYLEVVMRGELRPADIEAVRISQLNYDLYWEYSFNDVASRLSEVDRFRTDTFATILYELEKRSIHFEGVD